MAIDRSLSGPRRLRPAQQSAMILARWPEFKLLQRGRLFVWKGPLRPTPLSPSYSVRISYTEWGAPKVTVLDPPLRNRGELRIPHRYKDGRLCLHLPREWSSSLYIADTIIPWAVLWLYHYEVWHITGEWLGGGEHPTADQERAEA